MVIKTSRLYLDTNSFFFIQPTTGVLKVHVFGEILWAKNFDYDDLHVYYQLELPRSKRTTWNDHWSSRLEVNQSFIL